MSSEKIDPVHNPRFAIFNEEERQFLANFFFLHPKVGENFQKFLVLPTTLRPQFAQTAIGDIERAGWVRRGIENPETVLAHSIGLAKLIEDCLPSCFASSPIDSQTQASTTQHLLDMAKLHDLLEAIATDFTPHDTISEEDKTRIELLAARVIFASPQHARSLALVTEFIEQKTNASHIVHDFDKIHACIIAYFYEMKYPEKQGIFQDFYEYSLKKMKTPLGRAYLEGLNRDKEQLKQLIESSEPSQSIGR